MSANTSIKEGGKGRSFGPVKALMVQGSDGKYYPWYPESERQLDTLSVDKNGIYQASKYGAYGWNRVSVNVPQNEGVTGKDPDTGEEVYVHPDPETGELVTDVLPVEIRVITPPTNPYGTYVDGQTISTEGMVVKAYDANGNEMQVVPNGEITLSPTVAVYDESADHYGGADATSDMDLSPFPNTIREYQNYHTVFDENHPYAYQDKSISNGGYLTIVTAGGSTYEILAASSRNCQIEYTTVYKNGRKETNSSDLTYGSNWTHGNSTVYWKKGEVLGTVDKESIATFSDNSVMYNNSVLRKVAWTMIFGDISEIPAGSPQTIAVSWPRTGDGIVLETTFDILVGPRGGGGED